MGDLADKTLKKYDDRRADKQIKDELSCDNQQARKVYGMTRWNDVKEAVIKECKDLNVKAGRRSIKLTVRNSVISELDVWADIDGKTRRIHASFEESAGTLSWDYCGRERLGWEIEATEDGNAQFVGDRGPKNAEWIADEMLSTLLDFA